MLTFCMNKQPSSPRVDNVGRLETEIGAPIDYGYKVKSQTYFVYRDATPPERRLKRVHSGASVFTLFSFH